MTDMKIALLYVKACFIEAYTAITIWFRTILNKF